MSASGWIVGVLICSILGLAKAAPCPWPRSVTSLQGSCVCSKNPAQELVVQCSSVDFDDLLTALKEYARGEVIDLLYVQNATIENVKDQSFVGLLINNIQLSQCHMEEVSPDAFLGLETSLKSLNLQENRFREIPSEALRRLTSLALLDLSANRLNYIPNDAFSGLQLTTLKLADNNLTLADNAFRGLEDTLRNLNLKNAGFQEIPYAARRLPSLTFLDLAQNNIRDIGEGIFRNLTSLTALNLERNSIESLKSYAFQDVRSTLSSLSLLSNLFSTFPADALSLLGQLKVLDIGFNLIEEIPGRALDKLTSLSLLAVDGNPIQTLHEGTFSSLKNTLRGLSLGGKHFRCDCKIRWITEWIRDNDLQITSREKDPQYCGYPEELRETNFYDVLPEDLEKCEEETVPVATTPMHSSTTQTSTRRIDYSAEIDAEEEMLEGLITPATSRKPLLQPSSTITTTEEMIEASELPESQSDDVDIDLPPSPAKPFIPNGSSSTRTGNLGRPYIPLQPSIRNGYKHAGYDYDPNAVDTGELELKGLRNVYIKDAYRQDSSIVISWDTDNSNLLGFRVVYRLFGESIFQPGPPLEPIEREFKIKNVPYEENVIVCVVSLEEGSVTPETLPFSQCREIRTESPNHVHMDKIIIVASAAICGTVVLAVVVFICCNRKRSKASEKERLREVLASPSVGTSVVHTAIASQNPSLGNFNSLGLAVPPTVKDWDQLSMYSGRSIPRPRSVMGTVNAGYLPEDARSQVSGYSMKPAVAIARSRSMAEGHPSYRSTSAMSGRFVPHPNHMSMSLGMVPSPVTGALPRPTEYASTQLNFQRSQFETKSLRNTHNTARNHPESRQRIPDENESRLWSPYREGSAFESGLIRHPSLGLKSMENLRKSIRRQNIDEEPTSSEDSLKTDSKWTRKNNAARKHVSSDLVNL